MICKEEVIKLPSLKQRHYFYVVIGRDKTTRLTIDTADVLINADGELDCPIDTVLRKNGYTFEDLNSWLAKEIQFIAVKEGSEEILRKISLNVNL